MLLQNTVNPSFSIGNFLPTEIHVWTSNLLTLARVFGPGGHVGPMDVPLLRSKAVSSALICNELMTYKSMGLVITSLP